MLKVEGTTKIYYIILMVAFIVPAVFLFFLFIIGKDSDNVSEAGYTALKVREVRSNYGQTISPSLGFPLV
jgi:hypothetical protein